MKTKYLFGMLLSGAMLAACTADDFNTAPVAQEVNPSAPVFTVSFADDDVQNRAEFLENGWKVRFEENDLLSLFHGIAATGDPTTSMKGWQNAIYKGGENEEGQFEFTTQAMVNFGYAVMVYPAETGFKDNPVEDNVGKEAPVIVIPKDQKEETKENTPYISEVIYISTDGKDKNGAAGKAGVAGYGKQYDVKLRRAASTLSLTLNKTDIDLKDPTVDPIVVTKVELNDGNTSNGLFTTSIPVKAKDLAGVSTAWSSDAYPSWAYGSELDSTAAVGVNALTTSDVKNDVATFTLLPRRANRRTSTTKLSEYVMVYTNYGTVKVSTTNADADKFWHMNINQKTTDNTIADGLEWVFSNLEYLNNASFKNEKTGVHMNSTLDVDLNGLEMDKLHIQNQAHLINAIKVYKAICPADDVTFYLDGTKGKFVLDEDGWNAIYQEQHRTGSNLKFAPCGDNSTELCTAIQLVNAAGATTEVPELKFEVNQNKTASGTPNIALALELVNKGWTYDSQDKTGDVETRKDLTGISSVVVTKGADLTLKNDIVAKNDITLVVNDGGEAIPSGEVILRENMNNFGSIYIESGCALRIGKKAGVDAIRTLTNKEAQGENVDGWSKGATITNYGVLGIVDASGSKIINYGVIDVKSATAHTSITQNQYASGGLVSHFGNGAVKDAAGTKYDPNQIGTIILHTATTKDKNYTTVADQNRQGFIKITINKADIAKHADIGDVANYVEFGPLCTEVVSDVTKDDEGNVTGYPHLPSTVKYVELQSSNIDLTGDFTLTGLFVRNGCSVNIAESGTVAVTSEANPSKGYLYIEGTGRIYQHNNLDLNKTTFVGYFGGDATDRTKITNDR